MVNLTTVQARESVRTLRRFGRSNLDDVKNAKAPNRQHFTTNVRRVKEFLSLFIGYDLSEFPRLLNAVGPSKMWTSSKLEYRSQ